MKPIKEHVLFTEIKMILINRKCNQVASPVGVVSCNQTVNETLL